VDTAFREGLSALGLPYVVGVTGSVTVWPPGHAPLPPAPYSGKGIRPTRQRLGDARHEQPLSAKELAFELEPAQWHSIEWREEAKNLPYPRITNLAAARRTQRHVPSSITCLRLRITTAAAALAQRLPRCPCCLRENARLNL